MNFNGTMRGTRGLNGGEGSKKINKDQKTKPGIKKIKIRITKNQIPVEMAKASKIGARGFKSEDQKKSKSWKIAKAGKCCNLRALATFQELQMLQVAVFVPLKSPNNLSFAILPALENDEKLLKVDEK